MSNISIDENDFLSTKIDNEDFSGSLNNVIKEQNAIKAGDLVIHINYGLGRFLGLDTVSYSGISKDFIKLEYANNIKLLVPVENFDLISKYSEYNPDIKFDRLGSSEWGVNRAKIREKIKDVADDLIKIASQRKISKGKIFSANIGEYEDFCNNFSFTPTKDQIKATDEILSDLSSGHIMDRLLCGDVGFGKTEVAIRASFVVANSKNKSQVAVIVPTTILCRQHFKQFTERFKNTEIKIASLSRFNTQKEIYKIKKDLEAGKIDIIIGTHSLLNKSIKFNDLGLVIIDEEQRFGVMQKERLKEIRTNTHILAMSATPIPRTLQMSITGLKDLSIISTPPVDRLNVDTAIFKYNDKKIKDIILNELSRNGKIFFVVPRIMDIKEVEVRLNKILPELKYCVIHGQMKADDIDNIMNDFYDGKYQLLIATTIIENGIDIQDANTMIVYKANNFGLAQLYQLRGRVGRGNKKAFAYLTIKENEIISDMAKKRLDIIESIKDLNSGFMISSADMDIRGTGNILGEKQSGHIRDIGINLYNKMLKKEIENINREANGFEFENYEFSPEIKLNISTIIPNNYVDNINIKMKFYKRIADAESNGELEEIKFELEVDYGDLPESVENLFKISDIKIICKRLNIQKLTVGDGGLVVNFFENRFAEPDKLINYIFNVNSGDKLKLVKDGVLYKVEENKDIFENVGDFLKILMKFVNDK